MTTILLRDDTHAAWWQTARLNSTFGILTSVRSDVKRTSAPAATEVLFFASRGTEGLSVHALPLSSHLLGHHLVPTPPASPTLHAEDAKEIAASFLRLGCASESEVVNEPPVRKRKNATDVFDEAAERRKKARSKGGQGVAAAAASRSGPCVPSLQHRRNTSNSQNVPVQSRPLSRSSSVASPRPATAAQPPQSRSSLSQMQNVDMSLKDASVEAKNKDVISRIVMAGMRLYGLSQQKGRKTHDDASSASQRDLAVERDTDTDRGEEEYKYVYHQTFKGTCFAFRTTTTSQDLLPFTLAIRDTVDKLLAIFCNDPLADGLPGGMSKLTPGGRKAFGSV